MPIILGIDAAWTLRQPSGVALAKSVGRKWRVVAVAPSYDTFLGLGAGTPVDWNARSHPGSTPPVEQLLSAAADLAGAPVDIVTIDMPVATTPIRSRRAADNQISSRFGAQGCSTHSPSSERPGRIGRNLTAAFAALGYPLATSRTRAGTLRRLLEVYPHPALLELLPCETRFKYKVSKSRRHWKETTVLQRYELLLRQFARIHDALRRELGPLPLALPSPEPANSLSSLKRFEDALDALVCVWVGARYLSGRVNAYGDDTAAVWCPQETRALPPKHA